MSEDDEFVARAGRLWVWIDRAIDRGMRVAIGAYFLLAALGVSWWLAGPVPFVLVAAITQTGIVLERRRLFPPEATA